MERRQFLERAVESLQFDERQPDLEPCPAGERRVRCHGACCRERFVMRALLGVDGPQRGENPPVVRRPRHRSFEKARLRRWRGGHEPLDVLLERVEGNGRRSTRCGDHAPAERLRQPSRHPLEDREEIGDRALVRHVRQLPARLEVDHARTDIDRRSDTDVPEDDLGGADQFADPDRRRAAERSRRRQLQPVEGRDPLIARERPDAQMIETFAQQHRRGLTNPERGSGAPRRLRLRLDGERQNQHARGRGRLPAGRVRGQQDQRARRQRGGSTWTKSSDEDVNLPVHRARQQTAHTRLCHDSVRDLPCLGRSDPCRRKSAALRRPGQESSRRRRSSHHRTAGAGPDTSGPPGICRRAARGSVSGPRSRGTPRPDSRYRRNRRSLYGFRAIARGIGHCRRLRSAVPRRGCAPPPG